MLKVGLTGGIGSGKTTACRYFEELGIRILDADIFARELMQPGQPGFDWARRNFGTAILTANGQLDRPFLRRIVFRSSDIRAQLEDLLHPLIFRRMQAALDKSAASSGYLILSVPLLLETDFNALVDRVLVIDTDPRNQLCRASERDRVDSAQIESMIAAQMDRQARLERADDLIVNNGSLHDLRDAVHQLHQYYQRLCGKT